MTDRAGVLGAALALVAVVSVFFLMAAPDTGPRGPAFAPSGPEAGDGRPAESMKGRAALPTLGPSSGNRGAAGHSSGRTTAEAHITAIPDATLQALLTDMRDGGRPAWTPEVVPTDAYLARRYRVVDVALSQNGEAMYVADTATALRVIDVSVPTQPVEVAQVEVPAQILDQDGDMLLVVGEGTISVVDISEPLRPQIHGQLVNALEAGTILNAVHVDRQRAFLSRSFPDRVELIDLHDLDRPRIRSRLTWISPAGVVTSGRYALVAHGYGLAVVDLDRRPTPSTVAELDWTMPNALAEEDGIVYLAHAGRLAVVDATAPLSPTLVATWTFPHSPSAATVTDGHLFITTLDSGFELFDITDPTRPSAIEHSVSLDLAHGVDVVAGLMALAVGDGYAVVDVRDAGRPQRLSHVSFAPPDPSQTPMP